MDRKQAHGPKFVERNIDTLRYRDMIKKNHYEKLTKLTELSDIKT